jgi:hypothetical protein
MSRWDREGKVSSRWHKKPRIGILYDMEWEANGANAAVWTDISPHDWKQEIEIAASKIGMKTQVEFIDTNADFDRFVAIVNPYGEVYPERNVRRFSTLHKIISYVSFGGLFLNVAGIPSYYAYSSPLRRFVDTTQAIFSGDVTGGTLSLFVTRPFQLTPLMQELSLQIVSFKSGAICSINSLLNISGMVGLHNGQLTLRRAAILEANTESCIPPLQVNLGGEKKLMTPLFFVKYGEGDFLLSMFWITDDSHDICNKNTIKMILVKQMLLRLNERQRTLART